MSRLCSVRNYYNVMGTFSDLFNDTKQISLNSFENGFKFKDGDVLLLGGGADISPSLYKQEPNRYCGASASPSDRDAEERMIVQNAVRSGIPIVGICRGAQLLCAMSGGSLYQHVVNHSGANHTMITVDGDKLDVTSAHHQMMNPMGSKHELIAWAEDVMSPVHLIEGDSNVSVDIEPEVVYFKETKGLAIQYHPEFMARSEDAVEYARNLVQKYLINQEK